MKIEFVKVNQEQLEKEVIWWNDITIEWFLCKIWIIHVCVPGMFISKIESMSIDMINVKCILLKQRESPKNRPVQMSIDVVNTKLMWKTCKQH